MSKKKQKRKKRAPGEGAKRKKRAPAREDDPRKELPAERPFRRAPPKPKRKPIRAR